MFTPAPLYLHTPMPTPGPLYLQTPSLPPTPTPVPTATPLVQPPPTPPQVVLGDFTTNAPPSAASIWSSLTWRRLSADDPLTAVRNVVRWRGGYLAIGDEWAPDWTETRTPVWVSADGVSWRLLAPQAFGPSTVIAGIVEVRGRLLAVSPGLAWNTGGIQVWTSSDGVAWTARNLPDLTPAGSHWQGPLVAAGPAGAVVAGWSEYQNADGTVSCSTVAAISADGETWTSVGSNAFPDNFCVTDLWGRADGYVAVGSLGASMYSWGGMALWSSDGKSWAPVDGPIVSAPSDSPYWVMGGVGAGSAGAIAFGSTQAAPGTEFWWQSSDGRHWTELFDYPPLGVYPGPGPGGVGGNGWLEADGTRLVALRTWTDPAAWVSFNGASWFTLTMNGDLPTGTGDPWLAAGCCQPMGIRVLPGGILFSNGATTWYGAATD